MSTKTPFVVDDTTGIPRAITSPDTIDPTFLPSSSSTTTGFASEALTDGDWVNISPGAGVASVRQANATADGREVWGFVRASYAPGAMVTVYVSGVNDRLTGLVPGATYFISTTAGQASRTVLAGSGNVVQTLGVAVSATAIAFTRGNPVTRA